MSIIIKLYNMQSGETEGYLQKYDPEKHESRLRPYPTGYVEFTPIPEMAMEFVNMGAAMDFYRQVSKKQPIRPDGKPNRPLTAYTAEFLEMTVAVPLQ